jgi:hypothetical protein
VPGLNDVLSARNNDENDKMMNLSLLSPDFAKPRWLKFLLLRDIAIFVKNWNAH